MSDNGNSALRRERLPAALRLVIQRYVRQILARKALTIPALVLPGIGMVLITYAPALVVARLAGAFARGEVSTTQALVPYLATFAGMFLAGEVVWRVALWFMTRAEVRGLEALYVEAMEELLQKDLAFFHDNFAGSLTKRALGYARRFEDVFDVLCFNVCANLLPLIFAGVVLWLYSPLLMLTLVGFLMLTLALVLPFIRRRQRLVDVREIASNVMAGHVADSIANAETVRAFARQREEAAMHHANVADFGAKTVRSWDYQNFRIDAITSPMSVIANTLGLALAVSLGRTNAANIESVILAFSYYGTATRVVWEFNQIYRNLESALTDAAQFTELLLEPPRVVDATTPQPFAPERHGVAFDAVSFRYPATTERLFDGFSLDVAPGQRVGLVGRSGGGKTTLTRLLLRFADIESGAITIGGHRIDRVAQSDLRRAIAYVPQDPSMFHRTIAENIRIGRPDATDEDVRRAARLAHAAEFIEALPRSYDTLVGERGVKLSGGQRQRVAIARAILKDAPILLLDEATSSLDSESEVLIQDALWTLMSRRTAIVIAHRLSTVRRMDELVVLEQGRIIERGPHETLLAAGGVYASLWAHQSGGFLPTEDAVETRGAL
jgi:ATP-binding cassette, subfamily B, bacterial